MGISQIVTTIKVATNSESYNKRECLHSKKEWPNLHPYAWLDTLHQNFKNN